MYRLLADFLNDFAIILDVVSPHLDDFVALFTSYRFGSGLRITALCLSGSLRALCGVVAGGSKAALSLHFAISSANGSGDIGDLNAKDGSKETVLALLGLLCGTALLPYITTRRSTYMALFFLLSCHLGANYVAVRGLALRTLNRQRASIAWARFREDTDGVASLTPKQISLEERVFAHPAHLHDVRSGATIGYCMIASSFLSMFDGSRNRRPYDRRRSRFTLNVPIHQLLRIFSRERYILWCDPRGTRNRPAHISIVLKEAHTQADHLKAWVHAFEVAMMCRDLRLNSKKTKGDIDEGVQLIGAAYALIDGTFQTFIERLRANGWRIDEGTIVVGSPSIVVIGEAGDLLVDELRKEE